MSSEGLATLAVLNVAEGRLDTATERLRRAIDLRPADPRLHNDLAAVLCARAWDTGEVRWRLEALEEAERSLEVRPSRPALFNRSLILETLGLRARAIESWRRYLAEDRRSEWAAEAAERFDRLEREVPTGQLVAALLTGRETERAAFGRNPWADRQLGEKVLLGRWAERWLAGDRAGVEAALAEIDSLTSTLSPGSAGLLAESSGVLHAAARTGDRARLDRLARGHSAYVRGLRLYRAEQSRAAGLLLDQAISDLRAAGSPFEWRARLARAGTFPEPRWTELQRIESAARRRGFLALAAEARRLAAYWMNLEGRLASALDAYEEARRQFLALGESELAVVLAALRAELSEDTGNHAQAVVELARALAGAPMVSDPWNSYSLYVIASSAASGGLPRAAAELRREAAAFCPSLPERPLCNVDSLLRVAQLTPDFATAAETLAEAERLLDSVPESDGRRRTLLDLSVARAGWLAGEGRSPAEWVEAAALLADAVQQYRAARLSTAQARAQADLARVLGRLGDTAGSADAYRQALQSFRRWDQAERFQSENTDQGAPRELRTVYERLLELELAAAGGSPSSAAFLLSEEMRDRLAPRRSSGFALPSAADLDLWLAEVPPGTAIVEYALIDGRVTAWVLAGGTFQQVSLAVPDGLLESFRGLAVRQDLAAWRRATGRVYEALLAPVRELLPGGTSRVVLIPDAELYGVPFRALWQPGVGRYLDEDLVLSFAPSMRAALGRTGDDEPVPSPGMPVLSEGFTEFAPVLGLDRLPRAAQEAAAVRAVYGTAGDGCPVADWESLRRCAPGAEVLHLATHAAADSAPGGSWIAFPEETLSLERLWRELPTLDRHPLVVLSSCFSVATAGGREGFGGLARPFLASGARGVVGTLWRIDDEDAAALFPAFHRAYRSTGDAAEALRRARQDFARWRERPWTWGGVEVIESIDLRKDDPS